MEKPRIRQKPTVKSKRKVFNASDLDAARLILSDVDAHGGEFSLAVRFARAVVLKAEQERCG